MFRQGHRLLSHRGSSADAFRAFAALWPLHAGPTESGNDQYLAHIWTAGGDASGWIPEITNHPIVVEEHPERFLCYSPLFCCGFCDRYDEATLSSVTSWIWNGERGGITPQLIPASLAGFVREFDYCLFNLHAGENTFLLGQRCRYGVFWGDKILYV